MLSFTAKAESTQYRNALAESGDIATALYWDHPAWAHLPGYESETSKADIERYMVAKP
jgi:hypothetical protein